LPSPRWSWSSCSTRRLPWAPSSRSGARFPNRPERFTIAPHVPRQVEADHARSSRPPRAPPARSVRRPLGPADGRFGVFATMQVSSRWFESFSIPGYSAYETNQKTVKTFGTGEQAPLVVVLQAKGDVTKRDLTPAIEKAAAINPGSQCQLVLRFAQPPLRLARSAHDLRRDLSAWTEHVLERGRTSTPCGLR